MHRIVKLIEKIYIHTVLNTFRKNKYAYKISLCTVISRFVVNVYHKGLAQFITILQGMISYEYPSDVSEYSAGLVGCGTDEE